VLIQIRLSESVCGEWFYEFATEGKKRTEEKRGEEGRREENRGEERREEKRGEEKREEEKRGEERRGEKRRGEEKRSTKSANSNLSVWHSRVLERGSLGPSTVTLMALLYVAICGGEELTMMVRVKLFPETKRKQIFRGTSTGQQHLHTIVSLISMLFSCYS
jgi:hypothetical protein